MAIWLLGPDPNGQCCGCEGKTSPCDSCSVDCCTIYANNHFEDFAEVKSYLDNDIGGCYFFPAYIQSSAYTRDSIAGSLTNGVLAGSTTMSSTVETLGISDNLFVAFPLTNGQTVNANYVLSSTPVLTPENYGHEVFIVSGGEVLALVSTLGAGNGTLSYTASGNGCFYLAAQIQNGMIIPPAFASTSISLSLSPNMSASPVVAGYGFPILYTGKYGCAECDPTAVELP